MSERLIAILNEKKKKVVDAFCRHDEPNKFTAKFYVLRKVVRKLTDHARIVYSTITSTHVVGSYYSSYIVDGVAMAIGPIFCQVILVFLFYEVFSVFHAFSFYSTPHCKFHVEKI